MRKRRATLVDTNNHANLEVEGVATLTDEGFVITFVSDDGTDHTHRLEREFGAASVYLHPETETQ